MAVTINTQILGQEITSQATYCYLYEPLRVFMQEDDLTSQKFYIDIEIIDTSDNTQVIESLYRYGDFDINPGKGLSVDLMKLVRQYHDANIYNFSHIDDIISPSHGWQSSVSKYVYNFLIYSDTNLIPQSIKKLPIIGGRIFENFTPGISQFQAITEADSAGIDLNNRWIGYPIFTNQLADPNIQDASPVLNKVISTQGEHPCGGYVIWKSTLGGWMSWGFDIKTKKLKKKYVNSLEVGMFESTADIDGSPYIPVDYTGIETSYSMTLKALSLTKEELEAVAGIEFSPAVYYMKNETGDLELMRMTSSTAPNKNLSNGGDFSISLKSISMTSQKTR